MDFVGRSHDAFVNLNPGDSLSFRFPFTTLGRIQIEAHYAGAEVRYIKGLKSKTEVDEWLQGKARIDWLRSQGYAK